MFYSVQDSFEKLLHGDGKGSWIFRTTLVCFFAHWAKDVHGYLYGFNETIKQYRADLANMRYGLMDLTKDSTKKGTCFLIPVPCAAGTTFNLYDVIYN